MSKNGKLQRMTIYKNSLIARLTSLSIILIRREKPKQTQKIQAVRLFIMKFFFSRRSLHIPSRFLSHSSFFVGLGTKFLKRLKRFSCFTEFFYALIPDTPVFLLPVVICRPIFNLLHTSYFPVVSQRARRETFSGMHGKWSRSKGVNTFPA